MAQNHPADTGTRLSNEARPPQASGVVSADDGRPSERESAAGESTPPPIATSFEEQVAAALRGIRAGRTPAEIRTALLAAGVEPLTADTAYRTARRRMFESNRRYGARLATISIAMLCGATLIFVPLGWSIPLAVVLLMGLLLMGVATLIWLTGIGADET